MDPNSKKKEIDRSTEGQLTIVHPQSTSALALILA